MFSNADIAEYYNTTLVHYNRWWKLRENLSLHYGIWDEGVKSFSESLINTNRLMMEISGISSGDKVLDAGCGVGGAAFYLNRMKNVEVIGISLSSKQIELASEYAVRNRIADRVSFRMMDFTKTTFNDESFDVVWACESVCQAQDKNAFIKESYRVLKKGGKLVVCDYFLPHAYQHDKHSWIRKWCDTWAISGLVTFDAFRDDLASTGYSNVRSYDYTDKIIRSSRRMYFSSLAGALPSVIYNLIHPNVSRFAKTHYKAGYYQYKALKEGLWRYVIVLAEKKN
jgi:ubiquinone/menaquinone biosynthesis C-methylase UbiE